MIFTECVCVCVCSLVCIRINMNPGTNVRPGALIMNKTRKRYRHFGIEVFAAVVAVLSNSCDISIDMVDAIYKNKSIQRLYLMTHICITFRLA